MDSRSATVRLSNYTQISGKSVGVSGTDEVVKNAGRGDELAYQMAKVGKELKRDILVFAKRNPKLFIDFVNTFNLPVLSFVDEPGFMIGQDSEEAGTIRHGTAAITAVMQSKVPWASVIIKKVYGVAGAAHFSPNGYVLSWPSAETGTLPVEGGVAIAFRKEIESAKDPDSKRRELEEMLAKRSSPFPRAENFSVHEIIDPRNTRKKLIFWLDLSIETRVEPKEIFKTSMRP